MKGLNIFYFDNDLGDYDEFNPRFVMEQKFAKEVVSLVSTKPPFFYDFGTLLIELNATRDELRTALDLLGNMSAIVEKDEHFCLNFPFFLDGDICEIQSIVANLLDRNKDVLLSKIRGLNEIVLQLYPNIECKLSLYHLLCGKIFDGMMFDYLEGRGLLKQSYIQKDNRDYMIIGYQNSYKCNKFNAELFCSFNNAKCKGNSLTSFGNASGERLDYFRYFKLREKNNLYGKFLKMHKFLKDEPNSDIVENSILTLLDFLDGKKVSGSKYLSALELTNYVNKGKIAVPVFDDYEIKIDTLFAEVKKELGDILTNILNELKLEVLSSNVACLKHDVPIEQLCNELWHMFFGMLNEYLMRMDVVAKPRRFFGQGKYLKCIYLRSDEI